MPRRSSAMAAHRCPPAAPQSAPAPRTSASFQSVVAEFLRVDHLFGPTRSATPGSADIEAMRQGLQEVEARLHSLQDLLTQRAMPVADTIADEIHAVVGRRRRS